MRRSSARLRASVRSGATSVVAASAGALKLAERLNLTPTGVAGIALIALGWMAARMLGSRTTFLMVYAAILTMAIAWLVTRRRLSIEVQRSDLPRRMRVGQQVGVELVVRGGKRLTSLTIEERVDPSLGRAAQIPIASLRAGEELRHGYRLTPTLRGRFQVGPAVATWSDPFGFTIHRQAVPEPIDIIVHPPTEPVHDRVLTRMWEDPPIRPPVSKPWPTGFEFYGMRDYVRGDDLRRIVWATLAKTGRVMVRESEQGITDRVVMYLDNGTEWHSPGPRSETFETAIRVAASLGSRHLDDGFSVTLLTNDGIVAHRLRGARARTTLLDTLAELAMTDTPMSASTHLLSDEATSHPHMVVITPHLGQQESKQCRRVSNQGVGLAVVHVVWEESDPLTPSRAVAAGARALQVEPGTSLGSVFSDRARAGVR